MQSQTNRADAARRPPAEKAPADEVFHQSIRVDPAPGDLGGPEAAHILDRVPERAFERAAPARATVTGGSAT